MKSSTSKVVCFPFRTRVSNFFLFQIVNTNLYLKKLPRSRGKRGRSSIKFLGKFSITVVQCYCTRGGGRKFKYIAEQKKFVGAYVIGCGSMGVWEVRTSLSKISLKKKIQNNTWADEGVVWYTNSERKLTLPLPQTPTPRMMYNCGNIQKFHG